MHVFERRGGASDGDPGARRCAPRAAGVISALKIFCSAFVSSCPPTPAVAVELTVHFQNSMTVPVEMVFVLSCSVYAATVVSFARGPRQGNSSMRYLPRGFLDPFADFDFFASNFLACVEAGGTIGGGRIRGEASSSNEKHTREFAGGTDAPMRGRRGRRRRVRRARCRRGRAGRRRWRIASWL